MRKFILNFFIVSILYFTIGCDKDSLSQADATVLQGKWKLSEYYEGFGSYSWNAVAKKEQGYILFNKNGEFESTVYNDFTNYIIKDSINLVLVKKDKSVLNFIYKLENGKLNMYPMIGCIEGCGNRFVKLEDLPVVN